MDKISTQTLKTLERQLAGEDNDLKKLELEIGRLTPAFERKKQELGREEARLNEVKNKAEVLRQRRQHTHDELDRLQREIKQQLDKEKVLRVSSPKTGITQGQTFSSSNNIRKAA